MEHDDFFKCLPDATGKRRARTDLRTYTAINMIRKGRTAFSMAEEVRQFEPQNMKCMKKLCKGVWDLYESEWLRRTNEAEIVQIESRYRKMGFPGCIGAVDCASWDWDNCPVGWQGLFTGKEGKTCCRLEVICDDNLRIWHVKFGIPGSKNDTTIMHNSSMFKDIRNKDWPPSLPRFEVQGFVVQTYYYLADGIYPKFLLFALPHPDPRTRKEKMYGARHSSARKAMERVFDVPFRQFRLLYNPSRPESKE